MRLSELSTKTTKDVSQSDPSRNAQLLTKAGFIDRLMAGAYSYLPLGLRVLMKIENIIREEMNAVGSQEILMPALHPRENWDQTGRWDKVDILYKLKGAGDRDLCLGPTHEEVVTPLIGRFIQSYRDLPKSVYQIQTKFRNEARAKSGLLRGREFRMKDLYSFHSTQEDLDTYYERVLQAYHKVYKRCGLGEITLLTYASGGIFSKFSHEFQTITPYGEDTVYKIPGTEVAVNKEIISEPGVVRDLMPGYKEGDENSLEEVRAIEVGNIFKLGSRFSDAFNLKFTDKEGKVNNLVMGCYGLGPSRVMGTIAECLSDDSGLVWPKEIAPYQVHLVSLLKDGQDADNLYHKLLENKFEVLYDDRSSAGAGEKFADADLIGCPYRLVISKKTLTENGIEFKKRGEKDGVIVPIDKAIEFING